MPSSIATGSEYCCVTLKQILLCRRKQREEIDRSAFYLKGGRCTNRCHRTDLSRARKTRIGMILSYSLSKPLFRKLVLDNEHILEHASYSEDRMSNTEPTGKDASGWVQPEIVKLQIEDSFRLVEQIGVIQFSYTVYPCSDWQNLQLMWNWSDSSKWVKRLLWAMPMGYTALVSWQDVLSISETI